MRSTPATIWIIALLLASCGDSCCDPETHICYFSNIDGGVDSAGPALPNFDNAACITPRIDDEPDPACGTDAFEPNGDFVMAAPMATCGTTTINATIGGRDLDVFRTGNCENASSSPGFDKALTPWAESNDDLRLCIFPTCVDGSTRILRCLETPAGEAPVATAEARDENFGTSPLGFHGCCRNGAGRITAVLDCPIESAKLDTFIWVEPRDFGACASYSVGYQIE